MNLIKVIVNPASAHGQTKKVWPEISSALTTFLGDYTYEFTTAKGHAREITKKFLADGGKWIVSVGGDGTLNEIVNGFYNDKKNMHPDSVLSVIPTGTGGDFAKTLNAQFQIENLLKKNDNKVKDYKVDVAKVTCPEGIRYFVNMASFAMGGVVVDRINRFKFMKTFGGKFGYYAVTLSTLLTNKNRIIEVNAKGNYIKEPIQNIAIANGMFQGGGMLMAPQADIQDGLFDVILFKDLGFFETIFLSDKIYKGKHIDHPKISSFKTASLEIKSSRNTPLDIDGETFGSQPVKFEMIPAGITIRG